MTGPKTNEREGTRALLRGAPMSAFKIRQVLDLIRGKDVALAADILRFCERGPAETVGKLLASAVANAVHNDQLDPEELFVSACYADESKTARRMRPRARGRGARIRKRTAHVTVIVSRLPEERLARLRAQRAAEQAQRRARRGGSRATTSPAADRARRTGRAQPETSTDAPLTDAPLTDAPLIDETALETPVIDAPSIDSPEIDDAAIQAAADAAVDEAAAGAAGTEDASATEAAPTGAVDETTPEADEHGSAE